MDLDAKDRRAVGQTVTELLAVHGASLRAVALWGEAASDAYRAGTSPLAIAVVVHRVDADLLRAITPYLRRWHRRRVGIPLLFDTEYLTSARDVFPLELLDLGDRHRVLWGDDPFVGLDVDLRALRTEVEEQLRGKMLHLWSAYLAARGSTPTVRRLLLESPAGFDVVLRGMLKLRATERPCSPAGLLAAVESTFAVSLPVMRTLASARAGTRRLARNEVDAMFEAYLEEVRALVGTVDRW